MGEWKEFAELIEDYRNELTDLHRRKNTTTCEEDKRLLSNMIVSTKFALDWLEKGKHPENKKSIENYSYDQRTIQVDPVLIQEMYDSNHKLHPAEKNELEESKLQLLEMATATLTKRELEVFYLIDGEQYKFKEVASMLGITVSNTNMIIKRARNKIKASKHSNLFLVDSL